MRIAGYEFDMSEEDRKIVSGYLSPYIKGFVSARLKQAASKAGPVIGLKAAKRADRALYGTGHTKLKFAVSKAVEALEKPKKKKAEAKAAKKAARIQAKLDKRAAKIKEKKRKKRKKIFEEGKLPFTAKLAVAAVRAVSG